jgi:hypothetical protein
MLQSSIWAKQDLTYKTDPRFKKALQYIVGNIVSVHSDETQYNDDRKTLFSIAKDDPS